MDSNLKDMMEEYSNTSFVPHKALFTRYPPGHTEKGYHTTLSAFLFPVRGKAHIDFSENHFDFLPGKVIHGCPGKWLTAQNDEEQPFEFFTLYYHCESANTEYIFIVPMNWILV